MNFLNIDWAKLINWLLPLSVRKPKIKAFLNVLLFPIKEIFSQTNQAQQQYVADLSINILTDTLLAKLQADYPTVGGFSCHIFNQWETIPQAYDKKLTEHHKQDYVYKLSEGSFTPDYDFFLSEKDLPYDYHVVVPTAYTANYTAITNLINRYRPAGKRMQLIFQNI